MEIYEVIVALGSAVIGGGMTGYYTLKATDKTIRDQDAKEQRREEKEIENLLDALSVELTTLWNFHMRRIGDLVEKLEDGQPLEYYYPLTQDYFTIYNSNAALIGKIKDCNISEAIVVTYNKCKKVVDGFIYNNDLYKEYRRDMYENDGSELSKARIKAARQALVDYAKVVKEDHYELKAYAEHLLKLIHQSPKIA